MTFTLQHNDSSSKSRLIKESVSDGWKPGDNPNFKYDYEGTYGVELWNMMSEVLDCFPDTFCSGVEVGQVNVDTWDIRLIEIHSVDIIELGIKSVFAVETTSIETSPKGHNTSLSDRLSFFNKLPQVNSIPSLFTFIEAAEFHKFLPKKEICHVTELLSQGFTDGTIVSNDIIYAEKRVIQLLDIPNSEPEFGDFMSNHTINCSCFDEARDGLIGWEEWELETPKRLFDIEIGLYLPVINTKTSSPTRGEAFLQLENFLEEVSKSA